MVLPFHVMRRDDVKGIIPAQAMRRLRRVPQKAGRGTISAPCGWGQAPNPGKR